MLRYGHRLPRLFQRQHRAAAMPYDPAGALVKRSRGLVALIDMQHEAREAALEYLRFETVEELLSEALSAGEGSRPDADQIEGLRAVVQVSLTPVQQRSHARSNLHAEVRMTDHRSRVRQHAERDLGQKLARD